MSARKYVWLEAGYELFARNGITGIQIDAMTKIVGKSKTSFFHFFGSKELFLKELYAYWREECREIIQNLRTAPTDRPRLIFALDYLTSPDSNEDFYLHLKSYAEKDEDARKYLLDVEDMRRQFLENYLKDLGCPEENLYEEIQFLSVMIFGYLMLRPGYNRDLYDLRETRKAIYKNLLSKDWVLEKWKSQELNPPKEES